MRLNTESYLISLLAVSFVPFALPGLWSGDWFLALESGRFIASGKHLTSSLLARPVFFGSASIPLIALGEQLSSFQIYCAVASACALQVARSFISQAAPSGMLWLFGGSVFFLNVTANAWPKFLAAAFIVAAWISAADGRRDSGLMAGILIGFALATHNASVLFVPFILGRVWSRNGSLSSFFTSSMALLLTAGVICLPWEVYTLFEYGIYAKIHANPAVSQRLESLPVWLNAVLVALSTFVAWGPLVVLRHWLTTDAPFSPLRLQKELFWFTTSFLNGLAASLVGLLAPWFVGKRFKKSFAGIVELWSALSRFDRCAIAISLVGQSLLNPYYSSDGSLHTGWVPAGMGLLLGLIWCASRWTPGEQRAVIRSTFIFAFIPWAVFNFFLTFGLTFSVKLKEQIIAAGDDLSLAVAEKLVPLGLGAFPWIQLFTVLLLVLLYRRTTLARPGLAG